MPSDDVSPEPRPFHDNTESMKAAEAAVRVLRHGWANESASPACDKLLQQVVNWVHSPRRGVASGARLGTPTLETRRMLRDEDA